MLRFLNSGTKALAVASVSLIATMSSAQDVNLKMASGYPESSYLTQTLATFVDEVEATTEGGISVTLHNNQSLIKLQDVPNAVRSNQVAMGQVFTANLGNQNAMFTLDAIPFLAPDSESALLLWEAQKPYLDDWFAQQNMRILFPQFFPAQGFYTENKVEMQADLADLDMRIYSNSTQRMAELLGAQPLQVQFGEVPQAFATGLVNAMFTSPQTGIDVQAWDFTSNYNLVGAMRTKLIVVINEDEFQSLTESQQAALMDASARAKVAGLALSDTVTAAQLATLEENGLSVSLASDAFKAELKMIGEQMTAEWREGANDDQIAVLETYLASKN
jgi:TRAP-type C4-dicarboxylate transport system substrate-binding protein